MNHGPWPNTISPVTPVELNQCEPNELNRNYSAMLKSQTNFQFGPFKDMCKDECKM